MTYITFVFRVITVPSFAVSDSSVIPSKDAVRSQTTRSKSRSITRVLSVQNVCLHPQPCRVVCMKIDESVSNIVFIVIRPVRSGLPI